MIDKRNIKPKILEDRDFERLVTENAALAQAETEVKETPDANYGYYGVTNYGGFGNSSSETTATNNDDERFSLVRSFRFYNIVRGVLFSVQGHQHQHQQ